MTDASGLQQSFRWHDDMTNDAFKSGRCKGRTAIPIFLEGNVSMQAKDQQGDAASTRETP